MIERRGEAWVVRVYVKETGKYRWGGSFRFDRWGGNRGAKQAAKLADENLQAKLVEERFESLTGTRPVMSCGEWLTKYLAMKRDTLKLSSYDSLRYAVKPFREHFAPRPLNNISRIEASEWAQKQKAHAIPPIVALFNEAIDKELVDKNPFARLSRRSKGRGKQHPPTEAEMQKLMDACSVHKWYGPQMRALLTFAAYTGMRPGEIFALEWRDIDFEANEIRIRRRYYKGQLDTPKTGPRTAALTPPARDALLGLDRSLPHVFNNKSKDPITQSCFHHYWRRVLDTAKLDFDFYLATRHYCAHYLWVTLGLDKDDVAEQVGHVDTKLLEEVYGHREVGALDRIRGAFRDNVTPIRKVEEA